MSAVRRAGQPPAPSHASSGRGLPLGAAEPTPKRDPRPFVLPTYRTGPGHTRGRGGGYATLHRPPQRVRLCLGDAHRWPCRAQHLRPFWGVPSVLGSGTTAGGPSAPRKIAPPPPSTGEYWRGGGRGGVWDPKVCVPKMARSDFPFVNSVFSHDVTLVWGEGVQRWRGGGLDWIGVSLFLGGPSRGHAANQVHDSDM